MILYDKNGTFLGMGQGELSMLGYEDMQEFKSYFSDFADLFVNRPGYISKFKNFSWIDYILHSGAPNKNVILKHKNSTEIETELFISEIPLIQDINGFSTLYCIESDVVVKSKNLKTSQNIQPQDFEEKFIQQNIYNEEKNLTESYTQNRDDKANENHQIFEDDLSEDYKGQDYKESDSEKIEEDDFKDEPIHLKISSKTQETSNESEFKLKVNMDDDFLINDEATNPLSAKEEKINSLSMDNIPIMSQEFQDYIKIDSEENEDISVVAEKSIKKEDKTEENYIAQADTTEIDDIQFENIDFTQIAEDTGMDLGDIAAFIGDFIDEYKNRLTSLKDDDTSLDIDYIKNEAMKLKGVASNLQMKNISQTLNSIIESSSTNDISNLTKQLQQQIKDLEEQLF